MRLKGGTASPSVTVLASSTEPTTDTLLSTESASVDTKITVDILEDLKVVKSSNKENYTINDMANFVINITNDSNVDYKGLKLSDTLDSNLEYVSDSLKLDGYSLTDNLSNVNIGLLDIGETKQLSFSATCITTGNNLENSALVNGLYVDNDGADESINTESNTITFNIADEVIADATITKSINEEDLRVNETHIFTIDLVNTGNVTINNLKITDVLDAHFEFIPESIKIDDVPYIGDLSTPIEVGDLEVGNPRSVSFGVQCIEIGTNIINKATVNGTYTKEGSSVDFEKTSNELVMEIKEEIDVDVEITKSIDETDLRVNDIFKVTLEIENLGNTDVDNFSVRENLDAHLELVPNSIKIDDVPYEGDLSTSIPLNSLSSADIKTITFEVKAISVGDNLTNKVSGNGTYKDKYNADTPYEILSNEVLFNIKEAINIDIIADKSINDPDCRVGDIKTISIDVKNASNILISDATLTDELDNHFRLVENSIIVNEVDYPGNLDTPIELGDLNINNTVNVTFDVECISEGTNILNMATVNGTYLYKEEVIPVRDDTNEISVDIKSRLNPNYTVTKSILDNEFSVNNTTTVTILLENTGNIDIDDLTIIDELDAHLEFIPSSIKIDNVPYVGDLEDTISIELLEIGVQKAITFDVKAISVGTNILNTANVNATYTDHHQTTALNKNSNTISINITSELVGDFSIRKTVDKGNIKLTENATYTITITNTGNATLANIKLTDIIDDKLLLIPNTVKIDGVIQSVSSINNMLLRDLKVNEQIVVTFSVRAIDIGTNIVNTAYMTTSYINNEGEIININKTSNGAVINVFSETKGAVLFTKEVDKTICHLNDEINFILKFKNIGTVDLEHVHLADNFDDMFTYVENSTKIDGVVSGNIIEGLDFETLKVDEEHRIDFKAIANTVYDKVPNTAVMAAYYEEVTLNPITNEVYVKVLGDPKIDGALVKSTPNTNYRVNDLIPFTLTLNNTGTVDYDEVTLTDILSPNLKFVTNSLKIDGNTIVNKDINNGISLNNIDANSSKTITFNAVATTVGDSIVNSANASVRYKENGTVKEFNLESNEVIFNIDAEINPLLEIEKTSTYTNLLVDDIATITLRLKNLGNVTLNDIVLYDFIPNGLEYINNSLKLDYVETSGDINNGINIPNMEVDFVTFVTFDVKAKEMISSINNKAFATYSYLNSDEKSNKLAESNNLSFNITNNSNGNLEIVKSSNLINYKLGDEAIFSFVIENTGNTEDKDVTVKDVLPENYEFIENSITVDGKIVPGNINEGVNIGNIPKNSFKIVDFKARAVKVSNNINNTILGTFTYINDNNVPVTLEQSSNINITHIKDVGGINIEFTNESYRDTITLNDDNIFRLNIKNNSTTQISNVTLTDILTDNYKFIYDSVKVNDKKVSGDITKGLNIGSIGPNEKVFVTFEATGITLNNNIENRAQVNYEYTEEGTLKNESIDSNIVLTNIIEDIDTIVVIDKSAKYETTYLNEENIFTLTVQNIGDGAVRNVLIKDALDKHYELINDSTYIDNKRVSGDITDGITIDFINPMQVINITFAARAINIGDGITNIASSSYKFNNILNEPVTENTYSNEIITNIREKKYAELVLEKSASSSSIRLNTNNNFTIKVKNIGNTDAVNITIIDLLPDNYELVNEMVMNKNNNIFIDRLGPNENKEITYTARGIKLGTDIENIANCTYEYKNSLDTTIHEFASSNINLTNIMDNIEATVNIVKTQDKTNLIQNNTANITLDLKNSGNTIAKSVIVRDILPENYVFVENSLTYNNVPMEGNIVEGISVPNLNVDESATIKFKILAITVGKDIVNTAQVSYEYIDEFGNEVLETSISNEAISNIALYNTAELTLLKIAYPSNNYVGDRAKYKIYVKNTGNCPAERISLKDTLPVQLEFVNNSVYINGKNNNNITNKIIHIDTLLPDEEAVVEFEVICLSKASEVINTVEADYAYKMIEPDTYVFKNSRSGESRLKILERVNDDLLIEQNVERVSLPLWDINNFSFVLTNNRNVDLSNVVLTNYLKENYSLIEDSIRVNDTYKSNILKNSINNNIDPINVGTLNMRESKTVTFSAYAALPNTNILNVASASYEYVVDNEPVLGGVNSKESITNIIEKNTASISATVNMPNILEINKEKEISIDMSNIGDTKAIAVIVKGIFDEAFDLVPNSLMVDGVPSDDDILLGIIFDELNPNESKNISYKVIPKSVKNNAIITTNINYNYTDVNDINRNVTNNIDTSANIIIDAIPNFTFVKDSNQSDYLLDDTVTFRLIVTNSGEITLTDCVIKDILPSNYEFIPNSVKINGNYSSEDITVGINISEIEPRSRTVITYDTIAKTSGINIPNTANINYNYTTLEQVEINENLDSNTFTTNIFENIVPIIEITKEQKKNSLTKNDFNTYTINISNKGDIDISNIEIVDILDEHYEFVKDSLKINDIVTNNNPNYIFIDKLEANNNTKVEFDVIALNPSNNITNTSNLKFNFLNSIDELINVELNSNTVTSQILEAVSPEIVNLLNEISKEENGVATIIEKEILKLQTVLTNSEDLDIILQINESINNLIAELTNTENISKSKLDSIINKLQ